MAVGLIDTFYLPFAGALIDTEGIGNYVVGVVLKGEEGLLESLIQRGQDILMKMKEARNVNSILDGLRLIGNLSVSDMDHRDRDFLRSVGGQVMNILPKPLQDVLDEYYRWYLDCRNFFALMKWSFDKRVKDFEDIINTPSSLGDIKPETILEGQVGILSSVLENPPRIDPISALRVVALVAYVAALFLVNIALFPLLDGNAMASIVSLELTVLALLPTLEKWLSNR